MPSKVCRLRLRAGEPLGLSIYPRPTFLWLPLEIRNQIYRLLLKSPDVVTVFPPSIIKRDLTLGLLYVNRVIAIEAAVMFYGCNIFRLSSASDDYDSSGILDCWDLLYSFLVIIGARNRACLRYLEADISRPQRVMADAQGTISSFFGRGTYWLRKVHAQDLHTRTYPPVFEDNYESPSVDYISPGIEAVFKLLGHEGPKIQLSLLMESSELPQLAFSEYNCFSGWSGEVPSFIEIVARRFTCGSDELHPRVEVLWKGSPQKLQFISRSKTLRDAWDMLEVFDVYGPVRYWWLSWEVGAICRFTLRRKLVTYNEARETWECGPDRGYS